MTITRADILNELAKIAFADLDSRCRTNAPAPQSTARRDALLEY